MSLACCIWHVSPSPQECSSERCTCSCSGCRSCATARPPQVARTRTQRRPGPAPAAAAAPHLEFLVGPLTRRRRTDGIYVFNLGKTWEKLTLAARIIVAIENPQDIIAISARPYGQRAVLKFAHYTGAKATVGRHTPGARRWGRPSPAPQGAGGAVWLLGNLLAGRSRLSIIAQEVLDILLRLLIR